MNGLTASTPSQASIRLAVGGFLMMLVQSALLLVSPTLDLDACILIGVLTPVAGCAFLVAMIGIPEGPDRRRRRSHE